MDGQRLDAIAKAMARGASRRGLMQGIASGLIAGAWAALPERSAAQEAGADSGFSDAGLNQTGFGFGPGESCISDLQCDNSFPELGILACADNGFVYGAYGGALHCCRDRGGTCGGPLSDNDAACCGKLHCVGGRCG